MANTQSIKKVVDYLKKRKVVTLSDITLNCHLKPSSVKDVLYFLETRF